MPVERCVLASTYWATHSEFGPGAYDATWGKLPLGASRPFLNTGRTYHDVLAGEGAEDPYWRLARAYVTLQLNALAGEGGPPGVQRAWTAAGDLLAAYAEGAIPDDQPADLARASAIADALSVYLASMTGTYPVGAGDSIAISTTDGSYSTGCRPS